MTDQRLDPLQPGVPAADIAAVRELLTRVRAVDRRGPQDVPGQEARVLLARNRGSPVGLAWRTGDDPAELYVDPPHRRRGHGRALAGAALGAAGSGIWAHGTLPAARSLADSLGLAPTRRLLQLRRDLTGPFPVEPPNGVRIRTFVPGQDDEQFLGVNARAFEWHPEQGRLDLAGLRQAMATAWFDPAGIFLAVDDRGTVLGFHWTKVHAVDPTPPAEHTGSTEHAERAGHLGEVYVLGVDPRSQIRGLGAPLTAAGLAHLAGLGIGTVMLYVESDNQPALKLYQRWGFAEYAVDTVFARP